ncbi:hypothetical protein HL42_5692 [Trichophyton rubrum]|nr:hypothetical protein HL42_5692 [Trichophyton rubrum]
MTTCPVIIPGRRDKAYLTLKLDNSGDKGQFLQGELFQKAHGNYEAAISESGVIRVIDVGLVPFLLQRGNRDFKPALLLDLAGVGGSMGGKGLSKRPQVQWALVTPSTEYR